MLFLMESQVQWNSNLWKPGKKYLMYVFYPGLAPVEEFTENALQLQQVAEQPGWSRWTELQLQEEKSLAWKKHSCIGVGLHTQCLHVEVHQLHVSGSARSPSQLADAVWLLQSSYKGFWWCFFEHRSLLWTRRDFQRELGIILLNLFAFEVVLSKVEACYLNAPYPPLHFALVEWKLLTCARMYG